MAMQTMIPDNAVLERKALQAKTEQPADRQTPVRARLVTYSKNNCPQCSEWLLAPDWSEYLNERCVRHTWSCNACGYQFETSVYFAAAAA